MVGRRGAPTAGSATGRSCWATTDLRGFHGHSHRRTGHPERADEGRAAHWQPRPRRISRRAVCHQGQRTMVRWRPRRRTRTPYWAGELGHATGGLGLGPLKRHQERWWDGHAWTTRVSDDNSVTVDDGPLRPVHPVARRQRHWQQDRPFSVFGANKESHRYRDGVSDYGPSPTS